MIEVLFTQDFDWGEDPVAIKWQGCGNECTPSKIGDVVALGEGIAKELIDLGICQEIGESR